MTSLFTNAFWIINSPSNSGGKRQIDSPKKKIPQLVTAHEVVVFLFGSKVWNLFQAGNDTFSIFTYEFKYICIWYLLLSCFKTSRQRRKKDSMSFLGVCVIQNSFTTDCTEILFLNFLRSQQLTFPEKREHNCNENFRKMHVKIDHRFVEPPGRNYNIRVGVT